MEQGRVELGRAELARADPIPPVALGDLPERADLAGAWADLAGAVVRADLAA